MNSLIKGNICEKVLDVKCDHNSTFNQQVKILRQKTKAKAKSKC